MGLRRKNATDKEWLVKSKPIYEIVLLVTNRLNNAVANPPLPDDFDKVLQDANRRLLTVTESLKGLPNPSTQEARHTKKNFESAVKGYIKGIKFGLKFYTQAYKSEGLGDIFRSGGGLAKVAEAGLAVTLSSFVKSINSSQSTMEKVNAYFSTHLLEKAKMDKYQYLLARKNWPKLAEGVLKSLSDSFDKADDTLFLEFVELSERNNMLRENYLKLQEDTRGTEELIWLIAVTLERKGAQYCQKYAESDDVSLLDKSISLYRSSFTLNDNFIPGYFQLSVALAAKGEIEESKRSFDLGKKTYQKLRDSTTGLNSLEKAMLHQLSPNAIEEFEKGLASILSTYDKGAL